MRTLLLTFAAVLTLAAASCHAAVAYYAGTEVVATLPSGAAATLKNKVVTIVADLSSGQLVFILITAPSTTAGKNFDFTVGPTLPFRPNSLTSSNGVSYSYFSFLQFIGGTPTTQRQGLLYGPNVQTQLSSSSATKTSVPNSLIGKEVSVVSSSTTGGTVTSTTYNTALILQATQFANAGNLSLSDAVNAAKNFYTNNLKGQEVP